MRPTLQSVGRFFVGRLLMDSAAKPLRPRRLGQLPTAWGAFCAGFAREKASSRSGEVTSEAKSEGLFGAAHQHLTLSGCALRTENAGTSQWQHCGPGMPGPYGSTKKVPHAFLRGALFI